jgi:hypothetical protein
MTDGLARRTVIIGDDASGALTGFGHQETRYGSGCVVSYCKSTLDSDKLISEG